MCFGSKGDMGMLTVKGQYNEAVVYTDNLDKVTLRQGIENFPVLRRHSAKERLALQLVLAFIVPSFAR